MRLDELGYVHEGEAAPALSAEQQVYGQRCFRVALVEIHVGVGELLHLALQQHHHGEAWRLLPSLDHLEDAVVCGGEADNGSDRLAGGIGRADSDLGLLAGDV